MTIIRVTARGTTGEGRPALINSETIDIASEATGPEEFRKIVFSQGNTLDVLDTIEELERKLNDARSQ